MSSVLEKVHSSSSESQGLVKRKPQGKKHLFHLEKAPAHESDWAMYYCTLGDKVAETTAGAEHKLSSTGTCLLGICSGILLVSAQFGMSPSLSLVLPNDTNVRADVDIPTLSSSLVKLKTL
jgi:hypothetical protein